MRGRSVSLQCIQFRSCQCCNESKWR